MLPRRVDDRFDVHVYSSARETFRAIPLEFITTGIKKERIGRMPLSIFRRLQAKDLTRLSLLSRDQTQ